VVATQEPRPEGAPYYPDRVAISHTTSEDAGLLELGERLGRAVDVLYGKWELGLQGHFLAPPEPEPEPEPELEERSSYGEGVQLELPCPVVAINGVCEAGHHWAKACICNREWCKPSGLVRDKDGELARDENGDLVKGGGCGGNNGAAHERRKARWIPKAKKIGGMGRFVLTLPPEVRDQYRTQEALSKLGTAARRMMQRYGYKRGLRRWHFFGEDHPGHGLQGDGLPPYHPHLEVIVDGAWLKSKAKRAIKRSWANILGVSVDRINLYYQYVQPHDTKKKLHRISYALRPTFTDWRWDEPLAHELIGFHNAQTWGSKADWSGPDLWEVDPKKEPAALVRLEQGICPMHPESEMWPIRWGCSIDDVYHKHSKRCRGTIPIREIVPPYWKDAGWGGGYWRWTGVGDVPRARDGPG